MQQIVRDSRELLRQATRVCFVGCFTVSRPVSNLSASCPDVAASRWPAVAAAACSSKPRLFWSTGSARDDGASHPSRHDQLLTGWTFFRAWYSWQRPLQRRHNDLEACDSGGCVFLGGVLGHMRVSVENQRCLFIAMMFCSLKPSLVWPAKESRLQVGQYPSAIEDVGREAFVAVSLQGMCEVDSDCTPEETSVRIDATIKSTGKLMVVRQ